jgi:putative ABC transport system permease protein
MEADPDVAALDVGHIYPIRLEGAPTFLVGARLGRGWGEERFIWLQRPDGAPGLDRPGPDGTWPAYVSESFSRRYSKRVGDEVMLPTPAGARKLRVAGVFADYGNERGTIMIDPDQATGWYGDDSAVNAAAYLVEGADLETVRQRWAGKYPALAVRANATLRAEILRIFRQTFSITYALKVIGVVVAVAGLVLALISLLLERRRELATLKEVGMSAAQIRNTVMTEGAVVATIGLAGGLVLSLALGYVLIFVINRQSFGWTLGFAVPWGGMAALGVAVFAASVLSAAVVGQWSARLRGDQEE